MSASVQPAEIIGVGLTTPVGVFAQSSAAAVRAGICRFRESDVTTLDGAPLVMSLLADEYLPPLQAALTSPLTDRPVTARMLRLATHALPEACAPAGEPPPLLLAVPESRKGLPDPIHDEFIEHLQIQTGCRLDRRSSRLYRQGGAAGLLALREALELIASGCHPLVLVGGLDTFLDPARLEMLDEEERLAGPSPDGFVPGEAAVFLLLASPSAARRLARPPIARVVGVASGAEPGHRYSPEPSRGDGLSETLHSLFAAVPPELKVKTVYAGMNGERLPAKEWGIASLRSSDRFEEDSGLEDPADCIGDAGAALGPAMVGMAAIGLQQGYRRGPVLVWSTSDREARAAALLERPVS